MVTRMKVLGSIEVCAGRRLASSLTRAAT